MKSSLIVKRFKMREEIRISVRRLVEFILRCGDIDNRHKTSPDHAMQEGSRIHRMIQKRSGPEYRAEVSLKYVYESPDYDIVLEGRADGIITKTSGEVIIDEIKGIYKDLQFLKEPYTVHLAQAKCYAWIYLMQQKLESISVRMTYCNLDTEEIKYFEEEYQKENLAEWFQGLMDEYRKWAQFQYDWRCVRMQSIKGVQFPFAYREGQKELAAQVYRTIYLEKRLFLEAPTGVGKTISTLFPAIKAVGEEKGDKIFYLTAKTITGTVAKQTLSLLRKQDLRLKSVMITAKEKICPLEECNCNPVACQYAEGHYDRINMALYDLLQSEDEFDRDIIIQYAQKHRVCPFELCLDLSIFSDVVICDYNYVFDPNVYLRRFFSDGVKGEYIFLVDEAHNLVDRGREMYSAVLYKEDFLKIKKIVKGFDRKLERALESCNKLLLEYKREAENATVLESVDAFLIALTRCAGRMEQYLEEEAEKNTAEYRDEILNFYFDIRHFLNMGDLLDESYLVYTECEPDGRFKIKLFCVHPATNLRQCLSKGRSTVFFSATLLPVKYYMDLLSHDPEDYAVYAKSSFDERKRGLFIGTDVSSKYTRRGREEFEKIADAIFHVVNSKRGNYMVFFPSYRFLQDIYHILEEDYMPDFMAANTEVIYQTPSMGEAEREDFLQCFEDSQSDKCYVGFCVMGGIFSEGIDLKNDSLIGAVIVGTGLPQVCSERELLKDYFDQRDMNGFDYAYRYPGMNKVLQSAGRVIRTAEDTGVVVLLDERFCESRYKNLFPREWREISYIRTNQLQKEVNCFWEKAIKEDFM